MLLSFKWPIKIAVSKEHYEPRKIKFKRVADYKYTRKMHTYTCCTQKAFYKKEKEQYKSHQ